MAYVPGVTVPNPDGLVWEREQVYHFYTGQKAQAYVDEYIADLAFIAESPDSPFYEEYKNWMTSNVEDYSSIPEEKLPFALREKQPSLFAYTQAFYLWVAAGADNEARAKLNEIDELNNNLKELNDVLSMVGEVDAMVDDLASWDGSDDDKTSVFQAMVSVGARRGFMGQYDGSKNTNPFIEAYNDKMRKAGLGPTQESFDLTGRKATGGTMGAVFRSLQAEANKKGNELQRMMAESSSKISFQSAVNEGLESFGDRWIQMVTQTSTTS